MGQRSEYSVIKEPFIVCVAVRKETGSAFHVVHIGARKGKLDKTWVSVLEKKLKTKKEHMARHDSLKED